MALTLRHEIHRKQISWLFSFTGEWTVSLSVNGQEVDSCKVNVCDPSQVKVTGLKAGMSGNAHRFHSKFEVHFGKACEHWFDTPEYISCAAVKLWNRGEGLLCYYKIINYSCPLTHTHVTPI